MKNASNSCLRRGLPIGGGITLIIIEDPSTHLHSENKNLDHNFMEYCFVIRYTNLLQCIKYFKKGYSREYVILLFHNFDTEKIQIMVSQLQRYEQLQAIFVLYSSENVDNVVYKMQSNNDSKCFNGSRGKLIKNFNDCKLLVTDLQQYIIGAEKNLNNADLFNIWNSPEKALRDLRRESGSFVWTQTFRG